MSASCACGAEFQDTTKHTHSTPPHSAETDLDLQPWDKIRELTIAYDELYAYAKKTFLTELAQIETDTGVKLVCS